MKIHGISLSQKYGDLMGIQVICCNIVGLYTDWWFGTFYIFPYILGIIIPTD
jgi:hypothetical protein